MEANKANYFEGKSSTLKILHLQKIKLGKRQVFTILVS